MKKYLKYFITFAFTFILAWSLSTNNIHAACTGSPFTGCDPNKISCKDPSDDYWCCDNTTECAALNGQAFNPGSGVTRDKIKNTDPTLGCSGSSVENPQIYTALGCIPTSTRGFTSALLTFLIGTAGAIALVIMLIGTIQIMTGGDNPEAVKKGKELFTGAITGLLFIIFSVSLLKIIAGDIIQLPGFTTAIDKGERDR